MNLESSTNKNYSVELLRFVAATAVVFVHIPIVGVGHFGVDIFFTISGFVMMLSTEKSSRDFFLKRIIRVVPTYYIFTLGVFLIALIAPSLLIYTTADFTQLIKSVLFVPFDKNGSGHSPIMFLGWTLNYEMYFYLLFAFALKISSKYRDILVTLLLGVVYLLAQRYEALPLSTYASNIVFEFVLGIAIYRAYVTKAIGKAVILLSLVALSLFIANDFNGRLYDLGIGAALFFYVALYFLSDVKLPHWISILGGYSYALYLTHPYIILAFDRIFGWFGLSVYYQLSALVLSLIMVNCFAFLVWQKLEVPLTAYLRRNLLNVRLVAR